MNNQTFLSFEDFAETLKNEPIPYPDVENLKSRIYNANTKNTNYSKLKKIPLSLIILGICIITFAATAVAAIYSELFIHSKEGNATFIYTQTSEEQKEKDEEAWYTSKKWDYLKDEVRETLQEDEIAIIMVPELYEIDRYFWAIQQEKNFSSIEEMKNATTTDFYAPTRLLDLYHFSYGRINFEGPFDFEEIERLYTEAKQSGKPYMIKKGTTSKKASGILLSYESEEENLYSPDFLIMITEVGKDGFNYMSRGEPVQNSEIINIDGNQILYDPDHSLSIFFMEYNGKLYAYQIQGTEETSKEDFINIYREIMNH